VVYLLDEGLQEVAEAVAYQGFQEVQVQKLWEE
jgi:hypothetical protein